MKSDLVHIEFYFPNNKNNPKNKAKLVDLILDEMRESGSIDRAGFFDEKMLRSHILGLIGDADIDGYKVPSKAQVQKIRDCIEEAALKYNSHLAIPIKNYVYVLPYLPTEADVAMQGVMGCTPYSCVFYIFLSAELWTKKSLENTVAHELNHTIFNYYHYDILNDHTLLDKMVMEGLAENFRENFFDKSSAAWAIALTEDKAFKIFNDMDDKTLFSKDRDLIDGVLYGNSTYEHWAGYSIGYWLVKELLHNNLDLTWDTIMKLSSREILETIKNKKRV